MTADSQELWVYTEFLNVYRDYVLYLQQMGILLITAISVIFLRTVKSRIVLFTLLFILRFYWQ